MVKELYRITEGNALIVTEVGQHQMWAAQYYKYKEPHQLLTSGGLGTMGYGLGAAIGAKVGCPEKTVINIAGDGCFRMNMNEIATAARYNILNDNVDFVKLTEAMGAVGIRVTKKEEFEPALRKAMELGRPVVIDCIIDKDDKVFPMVPAGAAIEEVFDQDDLK